ncbi:MAG: hypothetical protein C4288_01070 [Leptolyngbya sp. ERB_1_1]
MVATKRRSPTSTLVSKDSISGASSALQDLPEKPKEIWSLREAIHLLKDQITLALDRGYSYTEVSQMLSSKGVEISPSTLKYYLSSARKEDGSSAKSRRRRRTMTMTAEALQNGSEALETATPEKPEEEKPKRTRSTTKTTKSPAKAAAKPAAKAKTTTDKTTKATTSRKKSDS